MEINIIKGPIKERLGESLMTGVVMYVETESDDEENLIAVVSLVINSLTRGNEMGDEWIFKGRIYDIFPSNYKGSLKAGVIVKGKYNTESCTGVLST